MIVVFDYKFENMDSFLSLFDSNSDNKTEEFNLDSVTNNNNKLPPEPQVGRVEYKLKLVSPSLTRFEHLVSQLKWRLREGNGEAIYEIGVLDNGYLVGLNETDMECSLNTLSKMASRLRATTKVLRKRKLESKNDDLYVTEVLVTQVPNDQNNVEIRVAVLGSVEAGKSTLVGVLTTGEIDNGRGSARLHVFRHLHEITTGRTSSISHETLGFDAAGELVLYNQYNLRTPNDICENSCKVVNFIDLGGCRRYLRTTIHGLSGYLPHHAMLVISSAASDIGTASEHLEVCKELEIPFFIVVSKIDLGETQRTNDLLKTLLQQVGNKKVPLFIRTSDDVFTVAAQQLKNTVVPIFHVSNVSGQGLDLLKQFLGLLSPGLNVKEKEKLEQLVPLFQIDEIFNSTHMKQITGGLLVHGVVTVGTPLLVGPFDDGSFRPIKVESIHRNRMPCRMVNAGQSASIRLDDHIQGLRSGMVLLGNDLDQSPPRGVVYFQAEVTVIFHPTALSIGCQGMIHIGNVAQLATVKGIMGGGPLLTNQTGSVMFIFSANPEYIYVSQRILFRNGKIKVTGQVTQVFPFVPQESGSPKSPKEDSTGIKDLKDMYSNRREKKNLLNSKFSPTSQETLPSVVNIVESYANTSSKKNV